MARRTARDDDRPTSPRGDRSASRRDDKAASKRSEGPETKRGDAPASPRGGDQAGPTQRQLRVAEEVRHALSAVFARETFHDPDLHDLHVTVTEVRASPDLKHMTAFVSGLGRDLTKKQFAGLRRVSPFLKRQVAPDVAEKNVRAKEPPLAPGGSGPNGVPGGTA